MSAWALLSWPPVVWKAPWKALKLRHLETSLDAAQADESHIRGQAVWVCESNAGLAGVAWEWIQIRGGIIALTDPMALVSNLYVVDHCSEQVTHQRRTLLLHSQLLNVDWQGEVRKLVRQRWRAPAAPARRAHRAIAVV